MMKMLQRGYARGGRHRLVKKMSSSCIELGYVQAIIRFLWYFDNCEFW